MYRLFSDSNWFTGTRSVPPTLANSGRTPAEGYTLMSHTTKARKGINNVTLLPFVCVSHRNDARGLLGGLTLANRASDGSFFARGE